MDTADVRNQVGDVIRRAASADGTAVSVNGLHGEAMRAFALQALQAATAARAEADGWVKWMADEARAAGATWQEIGDAHGVTRQWANKRFG